jgi:hypothetical protein
MFQKIADAETMLDSIQDAQLGFEAWLDLVTTRAIGAHVHDVVAKIADR